MLYCLYIGQIRGIMRIGAFAREIMMRGSLSIDLLLMCIGILCYSYRRVNGNWPIKSLTSIFGQLCEELSVGVVCV